MKSLTRRELLGASFLSASTFGKKANGAEILGYPTRNTKIRPERVQYRIDHFPLRAPLEFGGRFVRDLAVITVETLIADGRGRLARGWGAMPLSNVWAFPSQKLSFDQTLGAMKQLAGRIAAVVRDCREYGYPLELGFLLEKEFLRTADVLSRELALADSIPKLCTLVVSSAFDASIHDAYGKLCGVNTYNTYGPDSGMRDLSSLLGDEFQGEYLTQYLLAGPRHKMPLYHLVGAGDPLTESDIAERIYDGLPETLGEWIRHNSLTHFKIKLHGHDLKHDVDRVLAIERVVRQEQESRGESLWHYCLDFNESCESVDYLLEFLHQLEQSDPECRGRLRYIEQPTKRDLASDRSNVMHKAAALCPVVIDESLVDLESLILAKKMGYSGVALKTCKGQTQSLLMAAAAQKFQMFLCVQDLTCPGAALVQSVGLAARIPGVAGIEANARQYIPGASKPWQVHYPGLFNVKDGFMRSNHLTGPGLIPRLPADSGLLFGRK